eukprot:4749190-Pyramimonas_sp.AAC.1
MASAYSLTTLPTGLYMPVPRSVNAWRGSRAPAPSILRIILGGLSTKRAMPFPLSFQSAGMTSTCTTP